MRIVSNTATLDHALEVHHKSMALGVEPLGKIDEAESCCRVCFNYPLGS